METDNHAPAKPALKRAFISGSSPVHLAVSFGGRYFDALATLQTGQTIPHRFLLETEVYPRRNRELSSAHQLSKGRCAPLGKEAAAAFTRAKNYFTVAFTLYRRPKMAS